MSVRVKRADNTWQYLTGTGQIGLSGIAGPPGLPGDDGEDGWMGPPGPIGPSGTGGVPIRVTVGTVIPTDTGWVVPEALEIADGVSLEIAGGARVEVTGPVGNGLDVLASTTANNSTSVDFTFPRAYDDFFVDFLGIVPVTSGAVLRLTASIDSGVSYLATNYQRAVVLNANNAATPSGQADTAATFWNLGGPIAILTTEGITGRLRFFDPFRASIKHFKMEAGWIHTDTNRYSWCGSFWHTNTAAFTTVRFAMDTGNISSGIFRLYGLTKG